MGGRPQERSLFEQEGGVLLACVSSQRGRHCESELNEESAWAAGFSEVLTETLWSRGSAGGVVVRLRGR